jgi:hypothetical protein
MLRCQKLIFNEEKALRALFYLAFLAELPPDIHILFTRMEKFFGIGAKARNIAALAKAGAVYDLNLINPSRAHGDP